MNNIEIRLVKYIHDLGKGKIDFLTAFVSSVKMLAVLWTVVLLALFIFFHDQRVVLLERVAIVTVLHFAISEGFFKYFLPLYIGVRKRPYVAYPDKIIPIGYRFSDGSMPSSHIASTVAMVIALSSVFPALLVPGMIFAVIMGFSRIHNGMHYPSDVLVGALLGTIYGLVAIFFF